LRYEFVQKIYPRGKIFIIAGGGNANFTDVVATFTGLIKAIVSLQDDLKSHHVHVGNCNAVTVM